MPSKTTDNIQLAVDAFRTGKYRSLRAAGRAYDIHHSTLSARLKGAQSKQNSNRAKRSLSPVQEELLQQWIISLDIAGAAPTFPQVREFAGLISAANGGSNYIGAHWVERFLARHPDIKSKVGRTLDYLRAESSSPAVLEQFYNLFLVAVDKYKISTANTWNFDEHGVCIGICSNQRVLGRSTTRRSYIKTPNNRDWVTILECGNVEGIFTDPLLIFKGKDLQSTWFGTDIPDNWQFYSTANAWTSNQVSIAWLREVFIPQTRPKDDGYRLLLCDNYNSHTTIEFMWECFNNKIQLLFLPAHSSHILQPLDVGVFSHMKRIYRSEIANLLRLHETQDVQK